MKKPQTISVLQDLLTRLQQQEQEISALREVLDTQLLQLGQLQSAVDALHGRGIDSSGPHPLYAQPSPDEERRQGPRAAQGFTDRQEILFSAGRGWMWQP